VSTAVETLVRSALSFRGRVGVIALWLALLGAFALPSLRLQDVTNDEYVLPGGSETARIQHVLRTRFAGGDQRLVLLVYRRSGGLTAADKRRIVRDARRAAAVPHVGQPTAPFTARSPAGLVSRSGAVAFTLVPLSAGRVFRIRDTIEELRNLDRRDPGLEVHVTGTPALIADVNSLVKEADVKLLAATSTLVLLLLLAVYRSAALAVLPLLVVGFGYAIASGFVYVLNRQLGLPVDSTSTSLLLVLMFGAGTDYCLLLVARYRTALRRHERPVDAMREALIAAGPAIVASAATVAAALLAMLAGVFGLNRTLGPVNAIGIGVVLLASLTLLPAILVALGRRAFWPATGRVRYDPAGEPSEAGGRWLSLGLAVRSRPALWLAVFAALLAAGAAGLALHRDALSPVSQFRSATDSTEGYAVVRSAFPAGTLAPTTVLVDRPQGPLRPRDLASVHARMRAVGGVSSVTDGGRRSRDGRAGTLTVVFADDPFSSAAMDRVERMRAVAESLAPGLQVLVGQGTGDRLDYLNGARRDWNVVVPLVLLVVLITLILLLRALVAPLYLLATVILSFAGTLGASLAFFRYVLGQEGVDPSILLVVFIFLVALGSDYNIFLMSRVREEAAAHRTREGQLRALVATGPVITSAGLVLAGTFAMLLILPVYALIEIGFAVALGVLVDTFVVRSICVPALGWLVGEVAWWPWPLDAERRHAPVAGIDAIRRGVAETVVRTALRTAPALAAASPEPVYRLRVVGGPAPAGELELTGPLEVGREDRPGLSLAGDVEVSRRHLRATPTPAGVVVEDLGSANGTYVNGMRIPGAALTRAGDRIGLGQTTLEVAAGGRPAYSIEIGSTGRHVPLAGPLDVGRGPEVGLLVTGDDLVSRTHARLTPTSDGVLVEDLASLNGTFVGGERIVGARLARPGERIVVGATALEIRG
jgi:RND superfamily putative drug exporter